jgi:hypothetical protein
VNISRANRVFCQGLMSPVKPPAPRRLCRNSKILSFRASPASLPLTRYEVGRDPESRKITKKNQIILDPGSHPAPRDLAGMTNRETTSRRVKYSQQACSREGRWHECQDKSGRGFTRRAGNWAKGSVFQRSPIVVQA